PHHRPRADVLLHLRAVHVLVQRRPHREGVAILAADGLLLVGPRHDVLLQLHLPADPVLEERQDESGDPLRRVGPGPHRHVVRALQHHRSVPRPRLLPVHVDTTVRALEELRAKGYHDLSVYTPVPVHEIEDVVERDRPVSTVRLFTLLGGLAGLASGWIITAWSSLKWGIVVGGKPAIGFPVSPPYVVIMFELMILFGGIATVIGMVMLGRLPSFRRSASYDPRFTNDRFR